MKKTEITVLTSIFLGLFLVSPVLADRTAVDNQAELLYGKGVHAFFDNDYQATIHFMEQSAQLDDEDPRPYYFMAIAYSRQKKEDKADPLFQKAARLEWDGRSARDYDISGTLRRIQGKERIAIENYRKQARLNWEKEETRRREALYQKEKVDGKKVVEAISESFVGTAPFGARSVDPFRSDAVDRIVPKTKAADFTTSSKAKDAGKAGQETPSAAESEDDDPFGVKKEKEKKAKPPTKAATKAQEEDEDDPFKEFDE